MEDGTGNGGRAPDQRRDDARPLTKGERLFRLGYLVAKLDAIRQRVRVHGDEADAREAERLLQEIRALDPGFEAADNEAAMRETALAVEARWRQPRPTIYPAGMAREDLEE